MGSRVAQESNLFLAAQRGAEGVAHQLTGYTGSTGIANIRPSQFDEVYQSQSLMFGDDYDKYLDNPFNYQQCYNIYHMGKFILTLELTPASREDRLYYLLQHSHVSLDVMAGWFIQAIRDVNKNEVDQDGLRSTQDDVISMPRHPSLFLVANYLQWKSTNGQELMRGGIQAGEHGIKILKIFPYAAERLGLSGIIKPTNLRIYHENEQPGDFSLDETIGMTEKEYIDKHAPSVSVPGIGSFDPSIYRP